MEYIFDNSSIFLPTEVLYEDEHLQTKPRKRLHLQGWKISQNDFTHMLQVCTSLQELYLDHGVIQAEGLMVLRGLRTLSTFSMRNTITIDTNLSKLFGSWPALHKLDISENTVNVDAMQIISQTCKVLAVLHCEKCVGLDDICLSRIGDMAVRFRSLKRIYLCGCQGFRNEGVLALMTSASHLITHLSLSTSKCPTLSITSLRKKNTTLKHLDLSDISLGLSGFEWIAEGCNTLSYLNISKNPSLEDDAFVAIATRCRMLQHLDVSHCNKLTDEGLTRAFDALTTDVTYLDVSDVNLCGNKATDALRSKISIEHLKMNGLAQISSASLKSLFSSLACLVSFEMKVQLRMTITHRRSLIPHLDDTVFANNPSLAFISQLQVSGACRISDEGLKAFVRICRHLSKLDVSLCSLITDEGMFELAARQPRLKYLNASGCSRVTDAGAIRIFEKCLLLEHVELVGCPITDAAVVASFPLKHLQVFNIRSCSNVSDDAFLSLGKGYKSLKRIELSSLELVSTATIQHLVRTCDSLTELAAENCNVTFREYSTAVRRLPFSVPRKGCHLTNRVRCIVEFNKYVHWVRLKLRMQKILARFCRWAAHYRVFALIKKRRMYAVNRICSWIYHIVKRKRWMNILHAKVDENASALHLHKYMHTMMGIHYARRKTRQLRLECKSTITIQRYFRGHKCRRWYRRTLFDRLYFFYSKIGGLAHKYVVILKARQLHRQIVLVQSMMRMHLRYVAYKFIRKGFILLQQKIRSFLSILHQEHAFYQCVYDTTSLVFETITRRLKAAYIISHNMKTIQFNYSIRSFITACAVYFDHLYSLRWYCAITVQSYVRRYLARIRYLEHQRVMLLRLRCGIRIQAYWRMHVEYFNTQVRKIKAEAMRARWRGYTVQRPRIVLGLHVKPMQRLVRQHQFRVHRDQASTAIQRFYRAFRLKSWSLVVDTAIREEHAKTIQRLYAAFRFRRRLQFHKARRHMAAWKITMRVRRFLAANIAARKAIQAATAARVRREELDFKKQMVALKEQRELEEEDAMRNLPYLLLIQRRYRKHLASRDFLNVGASSKFQKLQMKSTVQQTIARHKATVAMQSTPFAKLMKKLPQPKVVAGQALKLLAHVLKPEELVTAEERPRLINSVVHYQSMTVRQGGIVDLCFTVGDSETSYFEIKQNTLKKTKAKHFVKVDKSITGPLGNEHLWVMFSSEPPMITDLEFAERPKDVRGKLKESRYRIGLKLCLHENVPIEIRGVQKKGSRSLAGIKVAHSKEDADECYKLGYTLAKNLSVYGCKASVWMSKESRLGDINDDDGDLYPLGHLETFFWCDDRLIRCVKAFNLKEDDVMMVRNVFENIKDWKGMPKDRPKSRERTRLKSREKEYLVLTEDVFMYLDTIEVTPPVKWIVGAVSPRRMEALLFSEYLHMVCSFSMLSVDDMVKLVFGQVDADGTYLLSRDQIIYIVKSLWGDGEGYRFYLKTFRGLNDADKVGFTLDDLDAFCRQNSSIMKTMLRIQQAFIKQNLGDAYWYKKMEQFKQIREEIGATSI